MQPKFLVAEVTNRCNAECLMCSHNKLPKEKLGDMNFYTFCDIVTQAYDMGIRKVVPQFFGEPALYPRLVEAIDFCQTFPEPVWTKIISNGVLINEEYIYKLCKAGLSEISISAEAADKENFERIRKGLKWEPFIKNIADVSSVMRQYGRKLIIALTLSDQLGTLKDKDKIVNFYKKFNCYVTVGNEIQTLHLQGRVDTHVEDIEKLECKQMYDRILVRWNGDVVVCCVDLWSDHVVGNVNKQSLKEIFYGEKMDLLRYNFRSLELCKMCGVACRKKIH